MAKTIQSIVERAKALMKKTEPRSITPTEVGQLHVDTLENVDQNASDIITVAKATGTLMANISDLSLQVSAKANKVGSVEKVNNILSLRSASNQYTDTATYTKICVVSQSKVAVGDIIRVAKGTTDVVCAIIIPKGNSTFYLKHSGNARDLYYIDTTNISTTKSYLVYARFAKTNFDVIGGMPSSDMMLIDLTDMFGAGNEPTTATEFAQALGYSSIDDVPYIPYSASAITMPDATSVKGLLTQKVMASEVCLGEYTLRCNGSSLVAVDSSGNETTLLGSASTTSLDDDTNSGLPNE